MLLLLFLFRNFSLELFVLRLRFKPTFLNILVFPSELRLRVFEYRALRKLFGPETDELTGQQRRLRNEDIYDLYSSNIFSGYQVMTIEMGGHEARTGEERVSYRTLVGRSEEWTPFGRPRIYKRQNRGGGGTDRIDLTQDKDRRQAFMNKVVNIRFP